MTFSFTPVPPRNKDLAWARRNGYDCEQDLMAGQLRMQCRNQTQNILRNWFLFAIMVALFFCAVPAKAWAPSGARETLTSEEPPKVSKALPTCADYLLMDDELRTTGIRVVLIRVLGSQGIEGEQMTCLLSHVHKIDMAINNICTSAPGPWEEIFVRAVALYSPHCGLEVTP